MEKEFSMDELNFNLPKRGDTVEGVVARIVNDTTIMVDFGSITEGTLHLDHYTLDKSITSFKDIVKVGDPIKAEVTKVEENDYGYRILLSNLGNAKKAAFEDVASENKSEPISAKIVSKVKSGYMATYKGVSFFLHESENPNLKKGDVVKAIITNLDEDRGTGRISIKAYERAKENEAKANEFATLNVGDVIEGTVSRIEPYGIFLEFGNLYGLVRLKEIDHIYIENPTAQFKIGETKKAKIISLEKGRVDLSFKALMKSPIEKFADEHKVSDKITVKAINKLPFGVVCELAPNVTGLLHKSEFSWNPNDNLLASLKIGDELEVAIISLDVEKNKVALSRRALIDNPWQRVTAKAGDLIEAKVTDVTPKGLKIEALGVDGVIDIRDIKLEKGSNKLSDYYSVGDVVKAIITKVEPKSWILNASIKALQEKEEREQFEKFMNNEKEDEAPITIGDVLKK